MAQAADFATGVFRPYAPPAVVPASGAHRWALRVVQLAAVAAVLAAVTYPAFELDRFFVPKELVLHLAALAVGLLCLRAARGLALGSADALLAALLVLSAASAAVAQNPWASTRALAITASGAVLFWGGRSLARAGLGEGVVAGLAAAVVLAAATALAQGYGLRLDLFSVNRAPGGTLGNRNFVAHLCAIGLPLLLVAALRARRGAALLLWAPGVAACAGVLLMTRSRAAWLGAAAALVVFGAGWIGSRAVRGHGRSALRLVVLLIVGGAGAAAVAVAPNALRWRSGTPYAETATNLVNYQEGSGQGRLVQYRVSAKLARMHPVLGVGPGNWPVAYPAQAARGDPSLDPNAAGMTTNPWPSSDWVAFASERGLPGVALLAALLGMLAMSGLQRARRAADPREALPGIALAAMLAATAVVGAFDAVLLLALPALVVWTAAGALSDGGAASPPRRFPAAARLLLGAVLTLAAGGAALRAAAQIGAMAYHHAGGRANLERAVRLDPGSYRSRLALARAYGRSPCARRQAQVDAALALYPEAAAPRALACRR